MEINIINIMTPHIHPKTIAVTSVELAYITQSPFLFVVKPSGH